MWHLRAEKAADLFKKPNFGLNDFPCLSHPRVEKKSKSENKIKPKDIGLWFFIFFFHPQRVMNNNVKCLLTYFMHLYTAITL